MKGKFKIFLFLSMVIFLVSFSFSDNKPKRFTKPHEEEAEKNWNNSKSFMNFVPTYSSSVFINYNISRDSAPQNETSVKISRKDSNRVVAAWRDFRRGVDPANRKVGYSYSTDGGSTWSVSKLLDSTLLPGGLIRNSDPAVGIDSAGNFYIAVIALTNTNENGTLAVYKSTDGGITFPIASIASQTGFEDKEYIGTDLTPGSPFYNNIYMSWTTFSVDIANLLTRSTNGGINWTTGVMINDLNHQGQGTDLAIGFNGDINVVWFTGDEVNEIIYFDKSTNGGNSFGTDVMVSQGAYSKIPFAPFSNPSIAADISGGIRNGYIYVTWDDARNGDPDVFMSRSTNRGTNWSSPLRINNDPVGNGKLQCWPWIEVNDSGNVAIIYYDSRNTTSNNIIDSYLAISIDGGISFNNYRLSTQSFPTNQPNGAVRFGDYIGIDFWKNKVVPVWTDERAGGFNMEAYTAIVSTPVYVNSLVNQIPDRFELKQNYPNPFNPTTKINYELPSAISGTNYVSLKIYDVLGNEVATLVNEFKQAGRYTVEFSATGGGSNLSSGIYFYKLVVIPSTWGNSLEAADFVAVKRMILIK